MSIIHRTTLPIIRILIFLIVFQGCRLSDRDTSTHMPLSLGNFPSNFKRQLDFESVVVSRPTAGYEFFLIRTKTSLYKYKISGEREWQVNYPGYVGMHPPVIFDDLIVVPTEIGQFVVLSKNDGSLKWKETNQDDFKYGHNIEDIAFGEKILVVAKFNAQITAHDIDNGKILWQQNIPERSSTYLVIENSILYVAADEFLIVYDLISGRELGRINFDTFVGPIIKNNGMFIVVLGPPERTEVAMIDLSSRTTLWRKYIKGFLSDSHGGIIADTKSIYLTGNKVVALSLATGDILWESQATEQLGKPIKLGNNIYVRDYDSTIYALDTNDGSIVGHLLIGKDSVLEGFDRGPVALDKVLIVPFGDNRVFMYEP